MNEIYTMDTVTSIFSTSNRDDQYGGSLQKRSKFLLKLQMKLERFQRKALGARVTADDCLRGGISMNDCII